MAWRWWEWWCQNLWIQLRISSNLFLSHPRESKRPNPCEKNLRIQKAKSLWKTCESKRPIPCEKLANPKGQILVKKTCESKSPNPCEKLTNPKGQILVKKNLRIQKAKSLWKTCKSKKAKTAILYAKTFGMLKLRIRLWLHPPQLFPHCWGKFTSSLEHSAPNPSFSLWPKILTFCQRWVWRKIWLQISWTLSWRNKITVCSPSARREILPGHPNNVYMIMFLW